MAAASWSPCLRAAAAVPAPPPPQRSAAAAAGPAPHAAPRAAAHRGLRGAARRAQPPERRRPAGAHGWRPTAAAAAGPAAAAAAAWLAGPVARHRRAEGRAAAARAAGRGAAAAARALRPRRELLEDRVRMEAYRQALLETCNDKVVLDVGCGTGVLSLFAAHGGARAVVAVEGSEKAAGYARRVIAKNGFEERITVVSGRIEDVADEVDAALRAASGSDKAEADVVVSEWMGYMLVYENMFRSVAFARDRWLAEGGIMIPKSCSVWAAPFSGKEIVKELGGFWREHPYGIDLSPLTTPAILEIVGRPVVDTLEDDSCVLAQPVELWQLDCRTASDDELGGHRAPFRFRVLRRAPFHGLAVWFTCELSRDVVLSTAPADEQTHWSQTLLFAGGTGGAAARGPKSVGKGDRVDGELRWSEVGRGLQISLEGAVTAGFYDGDGDAAAAPVPFSAEFEWVPDSDPEAEEEGHEGSGSEEDDADEEVVPWGFDQEEPQGRHVEKRERRRLLQQLLSEETDTATPPRRRGPPRLVMGASSPAGRPGGARTARCAS
ncbi:unnamed protein product [Prorocentrum cordatum]|uniref:Protein arginine N-methyltransferase domain-containing protein n=1 Tax=Prorocentrum cordatum TaxID=2364126 RepID=A0ABN9V8L2_9DINO|nr:unnamed protein product [Polarella glacialis]